MKVSKVSEMRSLDRTAVEQFGIVEELLMENAGEALYFSILKEFGIRDKKFLVFSGVGNNGGDGFVVARKIHSNGGKVKVFILGDRNKFKGAAKTNLDIICRVPIEVQQLESSESVKTDISHCNAIVDAIFGTGLTRDVGGLYRDVIELVNGSGKTVFSADIPSGVQGDTGKILGTAIRADYTVSFGFNGPFWQIREWVGMENLCMMMVEDPEFVQEMSEFWTEFVSRTMEPILDNVAVDSVSMSEDMAYKAHSMISPRMVRQFLLPAYNRWVSELKASGCPIVYMDSDGYVGELIPI